jgi:hypothetical protein
MKLIKIKNKFELKFSKKLFQQLSNSPTKQQSTFQDLLDKYQKASYCRVPENILCCDVDAYFIELVTDNFPDLPLTRDDIVEDEDDFNSVKLYKIGFSEFKKMLSALTYRNEDLDSFLSKNTRRSLLYFNNITPLISQFKKYISDKKSSAKPILGGEEFSDLFESVGDGASTDFEEVETTGVDLTSPPNSGNSGGGRFDGGGDTNTKINIGVIAEKIVYENLKSQHKIVNWVSKFAAKIPKEHPGYNPEGYDGLGYDIEYIDGDGNKIFVEVKGKSDSSLTFEISKNEVDKALEERSRYKLIFVTNVMDQKKRKIKDLGNIFSLGSDEDFFKNSSFTAIYKSFGIQFQEK